MFRRLILASAGAIAFSGAALAAEPLPPPPPPPPLWTGFYLGANAGGTWSSSNTVNTIGVPGPCDTRFIPCVSAPSSSMLSAELATFSVSHNNGGFIGGGQLGYNYQFVPSWVAGFEADIQGIAGSRGTTTLTSVLADPPFPANPFLQTAAVSRQVDWLGTLRGRLGFLATPTFLLYGTGGLAFGGVSATTNITQAVVNSTVTGPYFALGSLSATRVGWTAGGGIEWMFLPNWSLKAEYLYYNIGSVSYNLSPLVDTLLASGRIASSALVHSTTRFNGNVVRAGIDYHFNWAPAPVVAKY
jgi:outer membrane immunogenic protein